LAEPITVSCVKWGATWHSSTAVAVAVGERFAGARTKQANLRAAQEFGLTEHEIEVASLIAEGLTNKEIAGKLVISMRTVETHVQNILTKTSIRSRSQLAAWHAAYSGRAE
jgi:DNA-binding NarL/FixJ family response regulator